jgi:hypothetical protein
MGRIRRFGPSDPATPPLGGERHSNRTTTLRGPRWFSASRHGRIRLAYWRTMQSQLKLAGTPIRRLRHPRAQRCARPARAPPFGSGERAPEVGDAPWRTGGGAAAAQFARARHRRPGWHHEFPAGGDVAVGCRYGTQRSRWPQPTRARLAMPPMRGAADEAVNSSARCGCEGSKEYSAADERR